MNFTRSRTNTRPDGHVEVHFVPGRVGDQIKLAAVTVEYVRAGALYIGQQAIDGLHAWSTETREMVKRALERKARFHARGNVRAVPDDEKDLPILESCPPRPTLALVPAS